MAKRPRKRTGVEGRADASYLGPPGRQQNTGIKSGAPGGGTQPDVPVRTPRSYRGSDFRDFPHLVAQMPGQHMGQIIHPLAGMHVGQGLRNELAPEIAAYRDAVHQAQSGGVTPEERANLQKLRQGLRQDVHQDRHGDRSHPGGMSPQMQNLMQHHTLQGQPQPQPQGGGQVPPQMQAQLQSLIQQLMQGKIPDWMHQFLGGGQAGGAEQPRQFNPQPFEQFEDRPGGLGMIENQLDNRA